MTDAKRVQRRDRGRAKRECLHLPIAANPSLSAIAPGKGAPAKLVTAAKRGVAPAEVQSPFSSARRRLVV